MRETLTLRQKIGQRIFAGVDTLTLSVSEIELVRKYKIANFILFKNNIENKAQVRRLCGELDRLVRAETGVGAFIAIDEEGGSVSRLPDNILCVPSARCIAQESEPEKAYEMGMLTAKTMRECGMNFDFAPVLDVACNEDNRVIGDRSYSETPEIVSKYGIAMMRGLLDGGVMCCGKHFPGHGNTSVDSHIDMPVTDEARDVVTAVHLRPFDDAIKAGIPAIMSAHILYSSLVNEKVPATLSREILTDLLRIEMGFDGLIITDCLEMGAVAKTYGSNVAAMRAAAAGATMFTVSHSHTVAGECAETLKRAYESGALSMEEMDDAVSKIMRFKEKLSLA